MYRARRRGNREASTEEDQVSGSTPLMTAWRARARAAQRSFNAAEVGGIGEGTAAFARKGRRSLRDGTEMFMDLQSFSQEGEGGGISQASKSRENHVLLSPCRQGITRNGRTRGRLPAELVMTPLGRERGGACRLLCIANIRRNKFRKIRKKKVSGG